MSPNVAGVTFLAFGNGAPDVFSNIAAFSHGAHDLGLSGLLGAGVFVTMTVVGAVGLASTPKIRPGPLLRDSIFYGIAVITLFAFYYDGCITIVEALMFPIFYVFYVTIVIVLQFKCCTNLLSKIVCCCDRENNEEQATELTASLLDGPSLNAEPGSTLSVPEPKRKSTMSEFFDFDEEGEYMREIAQQKRYHFGIPRTAGLLRPHRMQTVSMDPLALSAALGERHAMADNGEGLNPDMVTAAIAKSKRAHSFSASSLPSHLSLFELTETPSSAIKHSKTEVLKRSKRQEEQNVVDDDELGDLDPLDAPDAAERGADLEEGEEEEEERIEPKNFKHHMEIMRAGFRVKWKAMKPGAKIFYILTYPVVLARRLTIPAVTMDSWSREEAALSVAFAPPFFFWATGHVDAAVGVVPLWAIGLGVGIVGAIPVYYFTQWSRPPKWNIVIIIIAFVMSVVWIMFIASELVTVLAGLGIIMNIPAAVLGLTVLAWGNSLGDMVANVSVARSGKPQMAIAGCYAGPMFNMLIGQGLSLVIVTTRSLINTGKGTFRMNQVNNTDWVTPLCFFSVLLSLVVGVGAAGFSKFTFTRVTAGILMAMYLIFMIICVLGEIKVGGHSLLPFLKNMALQPLASCG